MAVATNVSTATKLALLIPIYYEKRMLERLTPRLMYHQFGIPKDLPKREGNTVYWHRWNNLGYGRLIAESGAGGSEAISATRISATLYMIGHHAKITSYVDMVSINSIVQGAIDLFSDSAALSLDYMTSRLLLWKRTAASAQFQCSAATGYMNDRPMVLSAGTYYGTLSASGWQAPVWPINALSGGGGTRNKAVSAIPGKASSAPWSPNIFRNIALKLKMKYAPRFADGYYKAIMHPDLIHQLRSYSAFIDLHKYVETGAATFQKGDLRGGQIERGLVGFLEGFKIYESTEAPLFSTSGLFGGTANGNRAKMSAYGGGRLYFTFVFGENAFGVTDFDGGIKTFIKTPGPSSTDNPLDLYSTVGYRMIYTAKVLNNSACMWVVNGRPVATGA